MRTIEWNAERGCVRMVDQTLLPRTWEHHDSETIPDLVESIEMLRVRGAPALGAAGGYGVALATHRADGDDFEGFLDEVERLSTKVREARPTAVNLSWGVDRVLEKVREAGSEAEARDAALEEAEALADEDVEQNKAIGRNGASLLEDGDAVMTHCNAGALATVDWGTALGVIYSAKEQGKEVSVVANETRPLNQGSRITCYELQERGVDVTLIPDNASGLAMRRGMVDSVVVGSDRITRDAVFNKIGTYKHAVLAKENDVPFYVAAPISTFDFEKLADDVEIEQRDPEELRYIYGAQNAPEDVPVYNPAFDPTPMRYVDAIFTEKGVHEPPFTEEEFRALRD